MKKYFGYFLLIALCAFPFLGGQDFSLSMDANLIFSNPSWGHIGGTDSLGRDLLQRCLMGSYVSLLICFFSLVLTFTFGILIGSALSYWRRANHLMIFIVDVFDSIPNFLLVALFSILLNKGIGASHSVSQSFGVLVVSIALSAWPPIARNVRLEILQLQGKDYLNASIIAGGSAFHIIKTHYRLALWPWLQISLAHNIPHFLLIESVLSFIGLGLNGEYATLGYLINEGWKNALLFPHLFIVPSVVLCGLIFILTKSIQSLRPRILF